MRLSEKERKVIKTNAIRLDPMARIFLFGSRVNDNSVGGDIDLLIESQHFDLAKTAELRWNLMEQLGEQKFDIVIAKQSNKAFVEMIRTDAIEL